MGYGRCSANAPQQKKRTQPNKSNEINEMKASQRENEMKTNQLERQFINGVDEWSGLVGLNGVGHQAAPAARQANNNSNSIPANFAELNGIVGGGGAEELIYLRVMSRRLLCREEIPFRSATALLHFILLAHSLVEWQEAGRED